MKTWRSWIEQGLFWLSLIAVNAAALRVTDQRSQNIVLFLIVALLVNYATDFADDMWGVSDFVRDHWHMRKVRFVNTPRWPGGAGVFLLLFMVGLCLIGCAMGAMLLSL